MIIFYALMIIRYSDETPPFMNFKELDTLRDCLLVNCINKVI